MSLSLLRGRLLSWYETHRRDLPWRSTTDPWAILVSEVMLQQTSVAAVVPYYQRFMARWPDAATLAAESEDELLTLWSGLGYYRRARHLRQAAGMVAESGGRLPEHSAALRRLPGIGPYTAAAVASIAHGEPVAVVDGNVERVLCRLLALPGEARAIRKAADELLDRRRPGDFNQALMELGALVCRPRLPDCAACPLAAGCLGHAEGDPTRYPRAAPARPMVALVRAAIVIRRGDRVLLERRASDPNRGLLELPALEGRVESEALVRHLRARFGLRVAQLSALPAHRHTITRHRITLHPFSARLVSGRVRPPLLWASAGVSPLTTATRRILQALT